MRGKIKELWHRHLDRKPWIFRDRFGLGYLFAPEDNIAAYMTDNSVVPNVALLAYLQHSVTAGHIFVDLSPEVGGVAMLAARQVTPTGAVFAFTESAGLYRQLVNNVALNGLTQAVRVIGRSVLGSSQAVPSPTLDQFAGEWGVRTIDHLRLKDAVDLAVLQQTAGELLRSGAVRHLLLDDVDHEAIRELQAALNKLGFHVQLLSEDGKPRAVPENPEPGKVTITAAGAEAAHA